MSYWTGRRLVDVLDLDNSKLRLGFCLRRRCEWRHPNTFKMSKGFACSANVKVFVNSFKDNNVYDGWVLIPLGLRATICNMKYWF